MIKKVDGLKQRILIIGCLLLLMMNCVQVTADVAPSLASESAVLLDVATGQILYEKNMHSIRYPASITKIMTGLLLLESERMDETMTMSHEAVFSVPRGAAACCFRC
jgi:serine-type D-Ala-D-Ala carboxypeptidase (penicillin-binding protein 5/6)